MFEAAGERDNGAERSGLLKSVARLMQVSLLSAIALVGELRRRLPSTDREQALADLDADSGWKRKRVARHISTA